MKYLLFILAILPVSCTTEIKYPEGGFEYPVAIADNDTNYYRYPLRDSFSVRDSFSHCYDYFFYRPFNETNLSIRPQKKETFRLTYSTAFGYGIIITLTEDSLTVKKGAPPYIYERDTSGLTAIENSHLRLLERRYPIDTMHASRGSKRYLDSIITLYPQLLNPTYYHTIFEKTIRRNEKKFNYSQTKIVLPKSQFISFIKYLNSSGYWSMPYKIPCANLPMDGYAFTLEANTSRQYKIVTIMSCDHYREAAFAKVCRRLARLANMEKELPLSDD